jgi:hypothetical protein
MPYTIWHDGVLAGETDFEDAQRHGEHRAGIFRPTAHGLTILPRLTGMLSAAAGFKEEMAQCGLAEDSDNTDDIVDFFETSSSGRKVLEIGRTLADITLRHPDGHEMAVASMAFIDLAELAALSDRLGCEPEMDLHSLPKEAPQFVISVTLRAQVPTSG